jgi:hypothetical protein
MMVGIGGHWLVLLFTVAILAGLVWLILAGIRRYHRHLHRKL